MYEAARDRFQETFSPFREFTDARIEHWTYMLDAVRDWPIIGCGLGTYQYMNAAYQRRAWGTVWITADGQYMDLLVEGGLVSGAAVLLAVIGILAAIVLAFRKLKSNASVRDIGPVLVFVLMSQAMQLAADSSLVHHANLLTLAALLGGLLGGLVETTVVAEDGTLISHDTPRRRAVSLSLCTLFTAGGIVGGVEMISSASVFRFVDFVNRTAIASPRTQPLLDIEMMLQRAEYWSTKRPDDPFLHRAWSQLLELRFQLNHQEMMKPRSAMLEIKSDDELWSRASIESLYGYMVALEARGETATLEAIRRDPLVEVTLKSAEDHYRLAKRHLSTLASTDRYLTSSDLHIAVLSSIRKSDPEVRRGWMKHAVFCEPGRIPILIGVIAICESPRDDDIAKTLLKHLANLPGAPATAYLGEALNKYPPEVVLDELTPSTPEALVAFGRHPKAGSAAKEAMSRAAELIENEPERERSWRTWLLLAEALLAVDDVAGAEKACRAANELAPWSAEPHAKLAEILERQSKFAEAHREIENAVRLAPNDPRLHDAAARLLRLMTGAAALEDNQ
jgi:tetratricopeptide (TPR) repeat protein